MKAIKQMKVLIATSDRIAWREYNAGRDGRPYEIRCEQSRQIRK